MDGKGYRNIDEICEKAYESISDEEWCEGLDDWQRFLVMLRRGTPFERYIFKKKCKEALRQEIREVLEESIKSNLRMMIMRFIKRCYPEALEVAQEYVAKIDDSTILHELWLKVSTTEEQKEIRQFFHHESA